MVSAVSRPGRRVCARALLLLCCACACVLWLQRPTPSAPPSPTSPPPALFVSSGANGNDGHRNEENNTLDKNILYEMVECAPFPSALDLEYSNTYWQTLRSSRGAIYLYGAYLDVRNLSRIGPAVRLLAVNERITRPMRAHCQFWFEERPNTIIVDVIEYTPLWNSFWSRQQAGELEPYLLTCVLPADVRALRPAAVSLVEKPCDRATNCLRVHFDEPPDRAQKEFAVCVKGLDFQHEDLSVRLVEWIELVRLLGADKVFFYELQVHSNISKVLAYYRQRGVVESKPITLPVTSNRSGNWDVRLLRKYKKKRKTMNERQMELVPYNDCLYRHMYQYRWLVLLDIDEVIVPLQDPDWSSLLKRVVSLAARSGRPPRSSYHASNMYYLEGLQRAPEPGVPRYMHMLQRVYRTRPFTTPPHRVKAFHETGRVVALHNHLPRACFGGPCLTFAIAAALAQLQHYRADCHPALTAACGEMRAAPVRDAALLRWAPRLVPRVERALTELRLLPPP